MINSVSSEFAKYAEDRKSLEYLFQKAFQESAEARNLSFQRSRIMQMMNGAFNVAMIWAVICGYEKLVALLLLDGRAELRVDENAAMRFAASAAKKNPRYEAIVAMLLRYPRQAKVLKEFDPEIASRMRKYYSNAIGAIDCLNKMGLPSEIIQYCITEYNPVTKAYSELTESSKLITRSFNMLRLQPKHNKRKLTDAKPVEPNEPIAKRTRSQLKFVGHRF